MYTCKVCGRKFKSIKALGRRASMPLKHIDRLRLISPVAAASTYGSSKYGDAALSHSITTICPVTLLIRGLCRYMVAGVTGGIA